MKPVHTFDKSASIIMQQDKNIGYLEAQVKKQEGEIKELLQVCKDANKIIDSSQEDVVKLTKQKRALQYDLDELRHKTQIENHQMCTGMEPKFENTEPSAPPAPQVSEASNNDASNIIIDQLLTELQKANTALEERNQIISAKNDENSILKFQLDTLKAEMTALDRQAAENLDEHYVNLNHLEKNDAAIAAAFE